MTRVKFEDYGPVATGDSRLVHVPSVGHPPQRLHWRAAAALKELRAEALKAGFDLRVVSGWRPQLWPTRVVYEADMIAQYGSVAEGEKWRAYKSGHMTGLVLDFGTEGLRPISRTAEQQKQLPVYAWLMQHAGRFGLTTYWREPWHWELAIPYDEWQQGPGGAVWAALRKPLYAVGGATATVAVGWLLKNVFTTKRVA